MSQPATFRNGQPFEFGIPCSPTTFTQGVIMGSLSALDLFSFAFGSFADLIVTEEGSLSELGLFAALS